MSDMIYTSEQARAHTYQTILTEAQILRGQRIDYQKHSLELAYA